MKKTWIVIIAILMIGGGWYVSSQRTKSDIQSVASSNTSPAARNSQPFTFDLQSSRTFVVNKPQSLKFTIRDQNNRIYKSFDTSDEEILRLYLIRKDRTDFQRLHVGYDPHTGVFTMSGLVLPADGPYRLFAQFTVANAEKDTDGNEITTAPYTDITAGNIKSYVPEVPLAAKVITTADGFETNVFFAPGDDSPGAAPVDYFMANSTNTIAIEINKGGSPVKDLQAYRGSVGRIAAFGPNLEFSTANSEPLDNNQQTGLIIFNLKLSTPGLYRLFMQTEEGNKFSTFDYNVTAKAAPAVAPNNGGRG